MTVKLISITPKAEETVAYCARVSNPENQENPEFSKLLAYCIKNGHWSVFEQANMVVEVNTSRAIAAQILRHRTFTFQEFSQRYSSVDEYIEYEARRQDVKNRQNSIDDLDDEVKQWFRDCQFEVWKLSYEHYEAALKKGVAKECARFLLPLNTGTRLYMNGTIRSWIHYLGLRSDATTQLEHRELANAIKGIFITELPVVSKALGWTEVEK
jgi:thymidylate synthase (FAD)